MTLVANLVLIMIFNLQWWIEQHLNKLSSIHRATCLNLLSKVFFCNANYVFFKLTSQNPTRASILTALLKTCQKHEPFHGVASINGAHMITKVMAFVRLERLLPSFFANKLHE